MKFFALETDVEKIKQNFLCEGEGEVLTTRYHSLSFFFASLHEMMWTALLFGVGVLAWWMEAPMGFTIVILAVIWLLFVFFDFIKAFIDWQYDFVFVTTDKIVLVDQTSIIRRKVTPIHLENIGSISNETQYWGVFPFGKIVISLKEGEGTGRVILLYVPNADLAASKMSEVVTRYQRGGNRRDKERVGAADD